jgi:hypothetical protein
MKKQFTFIAIALFTIFYCNATLLAQNPVPEGWNTFYQNPSTEYVIFKNNVFPTISGERIQYGDYIGGFYYDPSDGQHHCGGYVMYDPSITTTSFNIYGDDSQHPGKDGFAAGDTIYWKIYSYKYNQTYDAFIEYGTDRPMYTTTGKFASMSYCQLINVASGNFRVFTYCSAYQSCSAADTTITISCNVIGGSGNYSYSWTSEPEGITANTMEFSIQPDITRIYGVTVTDLNNNTVTHGYTAHYKIEPAEIILATDTIICNTSSFQLRPTIINGKSYLWSTNGDGYFNGTSGKTAIYHPGEQDIINQYVDITLRVISNTTCHDTVYHTTHVSFTSPEASLVVYGPSEGCAGEVLGLTAVAVNYSSITWSTSGDGTFSNTTGLHTEYTPGTADASNGNVVISATGISTFPSCFSNATVNKNIIIHTAPTAHAGNDKTICPTATLSLSGLATNYDFIYWHSSGDGTFANINSLNTTYTPGEEDIANFGCTITLYAVSQDPCSYTVSDAMTLTIQTLTLSACDDMTILRGNTANVSATATNQGIVFWTTSGTGSFSNSTSLTTTYTPSENDCNNGGCTLTITAYPKSNCGGDPIYDDVELTIVNFSIEELNDYSICENNVVELSAVTHFCDNIVWTTSGDGTFSDNSNPVTTYTPGPQDIANGTVILTIFGFNSSSPDPVSQQSTVTISHLPVVNAGNDQLICNGETCSLSGTVSYSNFYHWSTSGNGTFTNSNALVTNYIPGTQDIANGSVTLTLTANSISPCSGTVSDNMLLTISTLSVSAGNNQSILIGSTTTLNGTVTGGSGNYTYSWTPANLVINPTDATTQTVGIFENTTFTLTVTDANYGCSNSATVSISVEGQLLSIETNATETVLCKGEPTTISVTAYNGDETNYSYSWTSNPAGFTSNNASFTVTPNVTTTYTVIVTDGISTQTDDVTITVNEPPITEAGDDIAIYNGETATLNGSVTGNSNSYSYLWSPAEYLDDPTIPNPTTIPLSSSVVFTLTGTDIETGCQSTDFMTVIITGDPLSISEVTATPNVMCLGESATLLVIATGGSETYTYSWISEPSGFTSDSQSPIVTPETTTTYIVTVSDGENSVSGSVTVTVNELPITEAGDDIEIYPTLSVTLDGSVTGNSDSYSYLWSPAEYLNDPTIPNPTTVKMYETTVFTLVGTDIATGCQTSDYMTVIVSGDSLSIEVAATPDVLCFGESSTVSVTANGGNGNYTYSWTSEPEGFISSETSFIVTPEVTTTYNITVTDGQSSVSGSVTVTVNELPITEAGDDIEIYPTLSVTLDGSVTGNSDAYSYLWSPAELLDDPTIPNPTTVKMYETTVFTLVGTDIATGCQTSDYMTVIVSGDSLSIEVAATPDVLCYGESSSTVSVIAHGGNGNYTYSWTSEPEGFISSETSFIVTPEVTTTYNITVTDGQSSVSGSVTVTVNELPITEAGDDIEIYPTLSVTLDGSVTGNSDSYSYLWSPAEYLNDPTIPNPTTVKMYETTVFTLVGTDIATGCQTSDYMTVIVSGDSLSIEVAATADVLCYGEFSTISVTANGGNGNYTYSWTSEPEGFTSSESSFTVSPKVTTTYIITVTDGQSSVNGSVTITVNELPITEAGDDIEIYPTLSVTLDGSVTGNSDSYSYLWSPAELLDDPTIPNPTTVKMYETTVFELVGTDLATGCQTSDYMTVIVSGDSLTIEVAATADVLCHGESSTVSVTANGGNGNYTYSWTSEPEGFTSSESSFAVIPDVTTTYMVIVTDGQSSVSGSVTIIVNETPITEAGEDIEIYPTLSVTLNGSVTGNSDSYSYLWSPAELLDDPTIPNPTTGKMYETTVFTLVGTDNITGCQSTDFMTVIVSGDSLTLEISATPEAICYGESSTLLASPNGGYETYTYSWVSDPEGFTSTEQSPVVSPEVTTTYTVTVTDGVSTLNGNITVTVGSRPEVNAGDDATICANSTFTATATADNYSSILWTTYGDGHFDDSSILNATYYPGPQDISNGSCTLNITVEAISPCIDPVSDELTLSFQNPATVYAGEDSYICETTTQSLNGSAENYSSILWVTDGDGSFSNETSLNTIYSPGINDIAEGSVTLTLTAVSINPCEDVVTDDITINIGQLPYIYAGDTQSILIGSTTVLNGIVEGGSGDFTYAWTPDSLVLTPNSLTTETEQIFTSTIFTLSATDNVYGCSVSSSTIVNVTGELLHVNINVTDSVLCLGESTTITALPTGGSSNNIYTWTSEPEGFTSSQQSITVSPSVTTIYTVTVDDGISVVTNSQTIYVNELPITEAGDDIEIYPTLSVTLDGSVTGNSDAYSYLWSPAEYLDDPTIPNPTTVKMYETTVFTLVGTDIATGCQTSDFMTVIVSGDSLTIEVAATPDALCYGESSTVSVTANGGNGNYTYSWTSEPEGFTSSESSFTVTPEVTTTYMVTVTDGQSSVSGSVTVTVNELPITEAGDDIEIYPTLSVTLDGSVTGNSDAYSYLWSPAELLDDATIPNPTTVKMYETTVFTLVGTDIATGCQTSDYMTVIVSGDSLTIEVAATPDALCYGESSTVSVTANGGNGNYTYSWTSEPEGLISSETSFIVTPEVTTTYNITVTDGQSSVSGSVTVIVNELPITEAGDDIEIYPTLSVTLDGSVTGNSDSYSYLWSPAELLDDPTIPNPTTVKMYETTVFTLVGTDIATGCQTSDYMTVIVSGDSLTIEVAATADVLCYGESSTVSVTAHGGNGNYTYSWTSEPEGFISNEAIVNVNPEVTTTYTINVSDGQSSVSGSVTIIVNETPITEAGNDIEIYPTLSVTLNGSVTGNSNSYSYLWSPAELLNDPTIPNPTTVKMYETTVFTLVGTDNITGCQSTDFMTVIVSGDSLTVEISATPEALCYGESTTLLATPNGGSGNYSYSWISNPIGFISWEQSAVVTPEVTTTYSVFVNDGHSTVSSSITVSVSEFPITEAGDDIEIYPTLSVTLNGSVTGNSSSYSYLWSPAEYLDDPTIPNPTTVALYETTTFTLVGTDDVSGCQSTDYMTVIVSGDPITIDISTTADVLCYGESSTVSVTAHGGNGNYTYSWVSEPAGFTSNQMSFTVTPETTTTYTVTVTDGQSSVSGSVTIIVNEIPITDAGEDIEIYPTLSVTLNGSVTGNSNSYSYLWSPAEYLDDPTIPNPTTVALYETTTFTLVGTDNITGCQSTDFMTVIVSGEPLSIDISTTADVLCHGESSTVSVTAHGGNGNYTYSWTSEPAGFTSDQMSFTVTPELTTTYLVTVSDGQSSVSGSVTIIVNETPITDAGEDIEIYPSLNVTLNGSVTGNSSSYSYLWSPAEYLDDPTIPNPTTVAMYETTTFTLVGTDNINGCQSTDFMTVIVSGEPLSIDISTTANVLCHGESTTVSVTAYGGNGTYTYSWTSEPAGFTSDQMSFTVTPELTTTYLVTVTDGQSSVNGSVTIIVNETPITDAGADMEIYSGMSVTLDGSVSGNSGPYTYLWSPAEYLDDPTIPNPTTIPLTETIVFTLTGTDIQTGCQSVDEMTITVSGDPLMVVATADPSPLCSGESSTLNAEATGGSGDYSYLWVASYGGFQSTEQSPIVTPCRTTTYIVTVSDGYSSVIDSTTVIVQSIPMTYAGVDKEIYPGLSVTLDGSVSGDSGPYTYLWSPAEYLDDPTIPNPTTIPLTETIVFTLTGTDTQTGCQNSDEVVITVSGSPLGVNVVAEPEVLCLGETSQLIAYVSGGNGNYSFSWTSNPAGFTSDEQAPEVTPLVTTTYTVVIDDGQSSVEGSITVTVNNNPVTYAGADVTIYPGITTTLNGSITGGSGNYTYNWSPEELVDDPHAANPTTVILNQTTVFTLTGVDNVTGCQSSDEVTITVAGTPFGILVGANPPEICLGEYSTLSVIPSGGTGTYTYYWTSDPEGFTSTYQFISVSPTVTTTYFVTVNDGMSTQSGSTVITVNNPPLTNAGVDQTILIGHSTQLDGLVTGGSGNYSYLWSPAQYVTDPTIPNPMTVALTESVVLTLTGTDEETGCQSSDNVMIIVSGSDLEVTINAESTELCYGESTTLTAVPSGGSGNYSYLWSSVPAGFTSTEQSPTVTPLTTSRFYVEVSDDFSTVETWIDITVYPNINTTLVFSSDTIIYHEEITITAYSNIDATYHWYPYDLEGASITLDTNYYEEGINYFYVVTTDTHGCHVVDSSSFYVKHDDGFNIIDDNSIVVRPNPFDDKVIIETTYNEPITIYSVTGQKVYESSGHETTMEIQTSSWKPGIYFVRTRNRNMKIVKM